MFINFVSYFEKKLKEITDIEFTISSERQLDTDDFNNEIVIKQLSGSTYNDSGNIPYEADIITNDPNSMMEIFTQFVLENTKKEFKELIKNKNGEFESYSITPFFQTPVVVSPEERYGSNVSSRIVLFFNAFYVKGINDISLLKIDGEELRTLNSTISYVTEAHSNKISGEELNKLKKKYSTVGISFQIVSKSSVFTNKLFKIIFGEASGNTPFVVDIELINGLKFQLTMFLTSCNFNTAENQLPSINVSMSIFDNRSN